jgi:hypothetical protein
MQKSGSAYIFNILNDLLVLSGNCDIRTLREKYHLTDVLLHHNCNAGKMTYAKVARLLAVSAREKSFVVKTHEAPTGIISLLLRLGSIKAVYIFRDPRDALLSAMDHGKRIRQEGKSHTFASLVDFEAALETVKIWLKNWQKWRGCKGAYLIRYEDLLSDPLSLTEGIAAYLRISVTADQISAVLSKYQRDRIGAAEKGTLHFNKGVMNRYRSEMPEEWKAAFRSRMGDVLLRMGYPIDS